MAEVETTTALPSTRRDRQASAPNMTTTSRPLSEISDNNGEHRRSITRESLKSRSRPSSEVKDFANEREAKRASIGGQHTITLNLNDYASTVAKRESPNPPSTPPVVYDGSALGPAIRSPPIPAIVRAESSGTDARVENGSSATVKGKEKAVDIDEPMPSSTAPSDTDAPVTIISPPPSSTPPIAAQHTLAPPVSSSVSSASFDTARSSIDLPPKPPTKSKPNWLRKASGSSLAALRSHSRSPKNDDSASVPALPVPPSLPPRKGKSPLTSTTDLPPPPVPQKASYANVTSSASSMDLRSASTDRPGQLPRKPSRDNIGRRIAAWTANAQQAFPRSSSSASLASQASLPAGPHPSHQRTHSQAQKVFDSAGAAVQKGLAGLRTRGMGGSISSLSSLGQPSRRGPMDPPAARSNAFVSRTSKDRSRPSQHPLTVTSEEFENAVVMRLGTPGASVVFGQDLVDAGQKTHVMDANAGDATEKRRRHCLPSIVVRCVEYLEIWGPKEEGIFRISGRSSHMHRLKKDFDSGADIDLRQCHPGDLDPHAVAGLFKWYLRDMPSSILTPTLLPMFDAYAKAKQGPFPPMPTPADLDQQVEHPRDELDTLLAKLPPAHWFLLADIVKLLDLIPRHVEANRMTLNALMISLGPSLNIPGGVINELLLRRTTLFASPPPIEEDGVTDLIDFGSVRIAPPSIPQATMIPLKDEPPLSARSSTPVSQMSEDSPPSKGTRQGRMPSKPSLTRLFSASTKNLHIDSQPVVTPSAVDTEPPRVDLTIDEMSPLPNFGKVPSPAQPPDDLPISPTEAKTPECADQVKQAEDSAYPAGTVQERIKAYPISSTPIADRFAKEVSLPPLRPNSLTSTISTVSDKRASFRRGQQTFFSPTSPRTHSRSQSGSVSVDKRSSASSSVRAMVKEMEGRDGA